MCLLIRTERKASPSYPLSASGPWRRVADRARRTRPCYRYLTGSEQKPGGRRVTFARPVLKGDFQERRMPPAEIEDTSGAEAGIQKSYLVVKAAELS
jgi:hypothetical protein